MKWPRVTVMYHFSNNGVKSKKKSVKICHRGDLSGKHFLQGGRS